MSDALYEKLAGVLHKPSPKQEMEKVPLPNPVEAGYAHPNPDGSRKKCGNCYKFSKDKRCTEVEGTIAAGGMCSYHIYGLPQQKAVDLGAKKLDKKLAGYVLTETSCDTCKAYRDGHCIAVQVDGEPAKVEAKGCCNRWKGK